MARSIFRRVKKSLLGSAKKRRVDYALQACWRVLELDSYHFGLWEESDPRDVEGARRAARRYTEHLLSYIPDGVRTVLDAGCGMGTTSSILQGRGYDVHALSPDPGNQAIVRERFGDSFPFHLSRIEDFVPPRRYDLVLMSESSQYVRLDRLFAKAAEILVPGGCLLLADYFRKEPTRYYRNCRVHAAFLAAAERCAFRIDKEEDITDRTAPTLAVGRDLYDRYVIPLAEVASAAMRDEVPRTTRLVQWLLRGQVRVLRDYIYEKVPAHLDPDEFQRRIVYKIYLFRAPGGMPMLDGAAPASIYSSQHLGV